MRRLAILGVLGLGLGGCSFGIRSVPNDWKETEEVDCSSSLGRPAFDGLLTILASVAHPALGIPNAIAAIYGVVQVSRCSNAKSQRADYQAAEAAEERDTRVAQRPDGPAPPSPPPSDDEEEAERAATEELRRQEKARLTRDRRAWASLTVDERRRWQTLSLRARRVVKQRAIERVSAADRVIEEARLAQ